MELDKTELKNEIKAELKSESHKPTFLERTESLMKLGDQQDGIRSGLDLEEVAVGKQVLNAALPGLGVALDVAVSNEQRFMNSFVSKRDDLDLQR